MAAKGNGTTRLGQALYLWRTVHRLSLRAAAAEIGISNVTLMRIEHGHMPDVSTWRRVEDWLFEQVGPTPRNRR